MENKKDNVQVMIGSGENSVFIEVGLNPEESRKRLDEKIDRMIEEFKKQEKKEQDEKRVLSLSNKNTKTKY